MGFAIGSTRLTADGVVGVSGRPTRVFCIVVHSGATAGVVQLRNGTGTGDTEYDEINGVANESKIVNYAGGLYFPDGCFYDEDTNVDYATIVYTNEIP